MKMPSSTMPMYLRLLRWYTFFIFQVILTFSMSRDLFSKIDRFHKHIDTIKRPSDEAYTKSH